MCESRSNSPEKKSNNMQFKCIKSMFYARYTLPSLAGQLLLCLLANSTHLTSLYLAS